MTSGLTLILVVAGAYLAARLAIDYLARRFLIVSGAEYLLLGILLGPRVSGLFSASVVDSFGPIMTLAIGWTGAVIGMNFHLPRLVRIRSRFYQVAILEALLSLTVVAGVMAAILIYGFDVEPAMALPPAIALGCIATASSLSGVGLIARQLLHRGPILRQVQVAGGMDACVSIVAFGLLLCVSHVPPPSEVRPPTPTEWMVITLAIGAAGGALFHLFLGSEHHPDRLFIALAGAITLASGATAYVRLSPLLSTMVMGAILVNTARNRDEVRQALVRVQRPLYFVLLLFAGAAWQPSSTGWILPIFAFFFIRLIAKIGSARLAARMSGMLPALGPDWGRALLGQGSLAIALALNYRIYDNSLLPNIVFTAAIVSVLLTDLLSAQFIRSTLRLYDERLGRRIPREAERAVVSGGEA
jgi:hypothetical protein